MSEVQGFFEIGIIFMMGLAFGLVIGWLIGVRDRSGRAHG